MALKRYTAFAPGNYGSTTGLVYVQLRDYSKSLDPPGPLANPGSVFSGVKQCHP